MPRSSGGRPCSRTAPRRRIVGTSTLRFDAAGLVVEQRDTWNQAAGQMAAARGLGPLVDRAGEAVATPKLSVGRQPGLAA